MKLQSAFSAARWVWLAAALLLALLAVAGFYPSPTSASSASLTATVHGDKSVDLAVSNHQGNWWFRINSWGTCTAVTGNSITGIQGYKLGTHSVWAYSNSSCGAQIATTTFTISAASLAATVNSDRSVDLTLSNGPSPWYFRIGIGACTAVSGTTISGIRGYAPGYHEVTAFATAGCTDFLVDAYFVIPDPPPPATLTATVHGDKSVDLAISNHQGNWWFRINSWGTCTAVTGNNITGIRGYNPGTHSVWAYSDSNCGTQIATTTFTIPTATLTATVNSDRSVDLTLSNGPSPWYFRIGIGSCTAVTGNSINGIQGYAPGYHEASAFATAGCAGTDFLTDAYFVIPDPPPPATLTATVHGDKSVDLAISNHTGNWWFKINWWGTCTAVTGNSITGIQGYKPGTHSVWAYSDSNCGDQIAATTFTISAASLDATVNSDRSVDLTLSNGPSPWYFRIGIGSCTTVTGNSITGIQGYAPGYHEATAFATAGCTDFLADAYFVIPDPPTLTATVNTDRSVGLNLSNGPSNWWFRINSWGTCTAAPGNTVSNIQGYQPGTHSVDAYSDSGCHTKIASSSFTISAATLTATVNTDRSVDLTLTGGPNNWWFRINWWGTCTAASGNTVSNIQGYQPGAHAVAAYSDGGCNYHVAAATFDLYSLSASGITHTTATLTLTGPFGDWWLKETAPNTGTCTAGEADYSHALSSLTSGADYTYKAYSDSACATTALQTVSFTTPVGVGNLSETSTQGSPSTSGGAWIANAFTTGSNTNGYTVSEVTVPISPGNGSGNVTLRIFSKNISTAKPVSSLVTLTNTGDAAGAYTFSCSGAGCDLSAGTGYFLVLSAATGYNYRWAATASNNQTGSVGWSIGDTYTASLDSGSSWTPDANVRVTKFSITAAPK